MSNYQWFNWCKILSESFVIIVNINHTFSKGALILNWLDVNFNLDLTLKDFAEFKFKASNIFTKILALIYFNLILIYLSSCSKGENDLTA